MVDPQQQPLGGTGSSPISSTRSITTTGEMRNGNNTGKDAAAMMTDPAAEQPGAEEEAGGFPTESPTSPRSSISRQQQSIFTNPCSQFKAYVKSGDLLEMASWVVVMAILAGLPRLISNTFYREIPYQQTAAGDILLEMLLDHDLVDETVNNQLLVVIGLVIPFLLQIIHCLLYGRPGSTHATICTYATSLGVATFTVEFVKHYVGYLRPNFYEKCGFDYDTLECDPNIDDGSGSFTGRKSFMSGHSSMSFAGLTVFSLYLQRCFGVGSGVERMVVVGGAAVVDDVGEDFDEGAASNVVIRYQQTRPSRLKRAISALSLLPMFVAVWIAASRVRDNYHHPADVVGGSVVGAAAAIWAVGVWFPPQLQILSA